ncbi:MAG TPA: sulfocyanin-like copper-binding protein [Ilumatobacteraceae bacterium]|jgi:uncharacterized cupredoxin-like copper-binding protein|nr:sulfocyanin-like copper-binding protein [Ilumatobacteraceae bacterium]
MRQSHFTARTMALVLALGAVAGCSSAAASTPTSGTEVHVSITDHTAVNLPMNFVIDKSTAPAGDVTFVVKNDGTIAHELVVLQTDTASGQIPVDAAGDPPAPVATGANKILEDNNVGETGEPDVAKGDTRTFTIKDMKPGHYVLVCNLAAHYQMGLRADFTVV